MYSWRSSSRRTKIVCVGLLGTRLGQQLTALHGGAPAAGGGAVARCADGCLGLILAIDDVLGPDDPTLVALGLAL